MTCMYNECCYIQGHLMSNTQRMQTVVLQVTETSVVILVRWQRFKGTRHAKLNYFQVQSNNLQNQCSVRMKYLEIPSLGTCKECCKYVPVIASK